QRGQGPAAEVAEGIREVSRAPAGPAAPPARRHPQRAPTPARPPLPSRAGPGARRPTPPRPTARPVLTTRGIPMSQRWAARALAGLCAAFAFAAAPPADGAAKTRVVLIDGQNNHNWRATTPLLKSELERTGRFTVDVSSNLKPGDRPGTAPSVPFPPDLGKYDVLVSNYNGAPWPKE